MATLEGARRATGIDLFVGFATIAVMTLVSPPRNSRLAVILFATVLIILWGNAAMAMTLNSPAFQPNGHIPSKYTCEDEDVSPPQDVFEGWAVEEIMGKVEGICREHPTAKFYQALIALVASRK